nr:MAG TPA: FAM150 family [Caudoviricetes sp.]
MFSLARKSTSGKTFLFGSLFSPPCIKYFVRLYNSTKSAFCQCLFSYFVRFFY